MGTTPCDRRKEAGLWCERDKEESHTLAREIQPLPGTDRNRSGAAGHDRPRRGPAVARRLLR